MTVPEKCDVCGDRHHKHQAHRFQLEHRADFLAVPIKTKEVEKHDLVVEATAEAYFTKRCGVCGVEFDSLRPHAKTCSAKCRQRKRRAARA